MHNFSAYSRKILTLKYYDVCCVTDDGEVYHIQYIINFLDSLLLRFFFYLISFSCCLIASFLDKSLLMLVFSLILFNFL